MVMAGVNEVRRACGTWGLPARRTEGGQLAPSFTRLEALRALRVLRGVWEAGQDPGGRYHEERRARRARASLRDDLPELGWYVTEYRRHLRRIIDTCRRAGVRLVLLPQPAVWRAGLPAEVEALLWFGQTLDRRVYVSTPALRRALDLFNGLTRECAAERGVELLDLTSLDAEPSLFYDDCHLNEAGARRAATLVAAWLREHPPAR
jgi:lysophospholipase L1-like esterase